MLSSIWPLKILAPSLSPSETFLAKYEINSINTNRGSSTKGQPAGTKRDKIFVPCFWSPKIVAPTTIVKLRKNVRLKCDVEARLYGIIPTKLFSRIKINNAKMKGKKFCPFIAFIWFITILYIVALIDSWLIDQKLASTVLEFVVISFNDRAINAVIDKYSPILVNETWNWSRTGTSKLIKSISSNWSKGLQNTHFTARS